MKALTGFSRIFVGVLFIISGFIKLNDPVGFSFKLQDYFAPEVLNLDFLSPYALPIAIIIVIYEVLLGFTLLVGYAKRFTLWSLILMIVFFTFLTFYSAVTGKVTDCGCFGDALKLTPWQSFYKDVVLLVLILILYAGRKYIVPFFSRNVRSLIVFAALVACLGVSYQVLMHLPMIDFRPYHIGANIEEGMSIPEGAPEAIFDYDWTFEVDGREKVVTTKGDYPKVEGKFIGVETREVQAGYEPPIHDFTMERGGEDHTQKFLAMDNLILVIAYSISNAEMQGFIPVKQVTDQAIRMGYKVIGLSASSPEVTRELAADYGLNFDFYFCDMTTLKTIVRSNPGILELQKGTIMQKLHWNDVDKLQLQELETALPDLDFNLKRSLDSIAKLDQMYRELIYTEAGEKRITKAAEMGLDPTLDYSVDGMWSRQMAIDKSNMALVSGLFDSLGYPGKSVVGEGTAKAAWYVLQHNPERIPDYIDLIRKAGSEGELPLRLVAMMEDRYLTNQNMPQLYGTQGMTYDDARGSFIWPIQDPENVNQRRREVGFTQTVEESAKDLFGPDFEYKVLTMDDIREQN